MALQSRTYSSSTTSNEYTLKLTITENSTSQINNTSNISYRLYMTSGSWNFDTFAVGWEISLNGKVVSEQARADAPQIDLDYNSSVTIVSGTTNVKHNPDGTLTMSISGKSFMAKESYTPGDMTVTGSMVLTPISAPEPPPRSDLNTISPFNLEGDIRVPYTSYSDDYIHTLIISKSGNRIATVENYANNSIINLSPEQILYAYSLVPGMSSSFYFQLQTYDGSSLIGTDNATVTGTIIGSIKRKINGVYRNCRPWVKINGVWKPTYCYTNVNGLYRNNNN